MRVTGSDKALYPPMSDQLAAAGITVYEGFDPSQLKPAPDLVVIGNAGLPRGHPGIEYVLDQGLPYTSGAEWLGDTILQGRWVLAVSGTHGKTTTASMLAHILDRAGLDPGFLIGGVPKDFGRSARLGQRAVFRRRSRRIRHVVFRSPLEVRPLPAEDTRHQQSRVRPRGHLPRPRRDSDAVPSVAAHGAVRRFDRRAGTRRSGRPLAEDGMLDAGGSRARSPTTA